MKRLKSILFFSTTLFIANGALFSQCAIGTDSGDQGNAPAPGTNTTYILCPAPSEYTTIMDVNVGQEYTVTYSGTDPYVTIFDDTYTAIEFGPSPLTFTAPSSGTYYSQFNLTACGTTPTTCYPCNWAASALPCVPEVAPWDEPFAGTTDPNCWAQSATSGGPWNYTGTPGYDVANTPDHTTGGGTNFAWIDFSGTNEGVILTTPEIDVSALDEPELVFWEVSHYSGSLNPYNLLYVEAWDGSTWQQVDVLQGETGPEWVEYIYNLSQWVYNVNLVQVRFRAEPGGSGSEFHNDLLLDDIAIRAANVCPPPIELQLNTAGLDSAVIEWTPVGTETEWVIEYGSPGFTPGSGTKKLVSPTGQYIDTIKNLPSYQYFDVHLRAVCGPGDTSFFYSQIEINTFDQARYMESDASCGPNFIDISTTGISTALTNDGEIGITLPFTLQYQRTLIDEITIGNNGGVLFGTLTGEVSTGGDIDASTPMGLFPFWDDLDSPEGDVYYHTVGNPLNQTFIVQWHQRTLNSGVVGQNVTFQLQIEEATGEIYFIYQDVEFGGTQTNADYGASAGIGIAGPNQNIAISNSDAAYLTNNACAHFFYTDCPMPVAYTVENVVSDQALISWDPGLADEMDWTVIYGVEGFDPQTGGTTLTVGYPATLLQGLEQLTTYDVYIFADCNPGTLQSNPITGKFTTLQNCPDPTGLVATTTVDSLLTSWSWTEVSGVGTYPSTGFKLMYGFDSFVPFDGDETIVDVDDNYTDTTFDASFFAGGAYEVYLQAVCGTDTSNWIGPVQFIMPLTNDAPCAPEALMLDGTVNIFSNDAATVDSGESSITPPLSPNCQTTNGWCDNGMDFTTWFTFTAPASGNMRLSGLDRNFDGQIAVYEVADCGGYTTFNLVGANDDDMEGQGVAPNFTLCGLTAGATYYLVHDSRGLATGIYSIRLTEIEPEAGATLGVIDVCSGGTVNLYDGISGHDLGGAWTEETPTPNFNDPLFPTTGLAYQVFNFEYRIYDGCAYDSVFQQVEIIEPSSAGTDGALSACLNEPIDLLSGLGGFLHQGGVWFNEQNIAIPGEIAAPATAGQYTYKYIAWNGVCTADTSYVVVTADGSCDYLNIEALVFGSMTLYPNPTSGSVFISNPGSEQVFDYELTDVNGKVIIAQTAAINGTETTEVDMENLNPGFYLIRVFNENADKTFRIIKE